MTVSIAAPAADFGGRSDVWRCSGIRMTAPMAAPGPSASAADLADRSGTWRRSEGTR